MECYTSGMEILRTTTPNSLSYHQRGVVLALLFVCVFFIFFPLYIEDNVFLKCGGGKTFSVFLSVFKIFIKTK